MSDPTPTTSAERDVYVPLDSGGTGSAGAEWARREQVRDVFDAASRSVVPPSAERVAALEQWQCVVVEWIDSCGSGGWHQPEDHHTRAIHCVTCGLLYSQNEDALTVVLSRDLDNGNVSGLITIPKLAVTLLRPIATLDEHA